MQKADAADLFEPYYHHKKYGTIVMHYTDTHINSKVMLIFYVWVKEHLVKNISIPLGSVTHIIFRLCL